CGTPRKGQHPMSTTRRRSLTRVALAALAPAVMLAGASLANAAVLNTASVTLSDARPSQAGTSYDFLASGVTTSTIKCVKVQFNTAVDGSGSKPSGLDVSAAALSGTTTYVPTPASWSV